MRLVDSLKYVMGNCNVPTPKLFLNKLNEYYHFADNNVNVVSPNVWELTMSFDHRGKIIEEKFRLDINERKYITNYTEI